MLKVFLVEDEIIVREGIRDRINWVENGFEFSGEASDGELALVHTPAYIDAIASGAIGTAALREIGFPWSEAMVERSRRSAGATVAAVRAAMTEGVVANMTAYHDYVQILGVIGWRLLRPRTIEELFALTGAVPGANWTTELIRDSTPHGDTASYAFLTWGSSPVQA